ncbi:hypothetical protein AU252_19780 [Pseudarthrobacter sulfonivorans]|uniref:Uncharacterized protein n=1 Tax=Pseudarthrobacter sulfonivorans TaxID=121292 RepID=A0A0U2XH89_9MICC|nr:hypothetical protein [Pseudarthrobacter sulfonivorans]ALV43122.1 hypothetical protein AU252_19780 [Pseudarthrobacter sulfonivorans]
MAPIDPAIKQNYIELHESTGESYESIAGRAASQDDKELASWLRAQAKGEQPNTEQEQRSEPPQGRLPAKQETAAADAEAQAKAEAEAKTAAETKAAADAEAKATAKK